MVSTQWPNLLNLDPETFIALAYLIIMIAVYSIAIYHFYRYIARRDCFKESKREHKKAVGFCKYFFLYPFVAMIFYLGFSGILIALTKTETYTIYEILSLSFAVVIAIRITAYYTEELSKDLAKMLPFAILGVFLVDTSYFKMDMVHTRISSLPENLTDIIQFLLLIIIVEWILRISLNVRYAIFPKKEENDIEPKT